MSHDRPPREDEPTLGDAAGSERIYAFADRLRERDAAEEEPERAEDWLAFRTAGRRFALAVAEVREIVRVGEISRLPGAPFPVVGAVNLRGRVLAVIDLAERLGLGKASIGDASRIVVLEARGRLVGLLVDGVDRLEPVVPSRIGPAPEELGGGDHLAGHYPLGDEGMTLLDGERLLLVRDFEGGA